MMIDCNRLMSPKIRPVHMRPSLDLANDLIESGLPDKKGIVLRSESSSVSL